jgi:hypothetical protein
MPLPSTALRCRFAGAIDPLERVFTFNSCPTKWLQPFYVFNALANLCGPKSSANVGSKIDPIQQARFRLSCLH